MKSALVVVFGAYIEFFTYKKESVIDGDGLE